MACLPASLLNAAPRFLPAPWWDQHGESGSKAGGLLLPVVYHGGWADEEDRPFAVGLPITLGQRQGLNRLAQAHVVGQARPQAPLPQERKPRIAADLVGPKCAAEALRRRKLLERRLPIQLLQQLSDPAGGLDAVEVEPLRRVLGLERHLDDVSHGRFLGALLLPEIDRRLNLRGVHLHPLTADPDQRGLHSRKRLQLAEGELPVSEGHFPIELDNRLQRQTAPSLHLRALDFGPDDQPDLRALARPPGRKHNAVARLLKSNGLFGQELMSLGSVKRVSGGLCVLETGRDARANTGSLPQRGEQELPHIRAISL